MRLRTIGQRLRAPLHLWWNLARAALGGHVGPFLDRKAVTPARRLKWRLLLSLVLLVKLPVAFILLVLAGAVVGVAGPLVLICTYSYGCLHEIWRD